ncbi:hypothetical protein, conserved [Eimeria praecox]|uniref:Uncharacterized protein n=1 Tax=Eimeria praecox TaxID=51316 RepID=U6G2Q8_9EIME|nr:hypothetical protein, conserved [Eimeria praecox]
MVATAENPLNRFLESPLWWPQNYAETSCGPAEVRAQCSVREASRDRIQQLRLILSEASFETVGLEAGEESQLRAGKCGISFEVAFDKESSDSLLRIKDVPPCFAPFTRFNCNVTLVAQRLFNTAMSVSVLCSGTAVIEECPESVIQILKHAKPGEGLYVRHVMLTAPERKDEKPLPSVEPFSYGLLLARLEALAPQVRDLVLSEMMPFGAILDRCGVRRSVETDRQLHVHMDSGFFKVSDKLPHPRNPDDPFEVAAEKELQGKDLRRLSLQASGNCQCRILPEGSCCTFGRLITVWCDGQPAARVVEILNERRVLRSLLMAEEEQKQHPKEAAAEAADSSAGVSFQSRLAFLIKRCLMSVALCPVHYKLLPKPHVNAESLLHLNSPNEGCRLCGSKTCSTEFHLAYTADLQ